MSKLENGRQTPTDDDIRDWTRVAGSVAETEALLASLHTLEVQHAEWQRVMRTGLRPRQQALLEWDQRTRLFRAFETTVVPGLLQTAEYARARFAEGIRRLRLPNDINDAVAARVQRQEILYRPDKRFRFVLTEAALRFRLCPPEVMLGQLDRLVSLSQLPDVRLGIIGFDPVRDLAVARVLALRQRTSADRDLLSLPGPAPAPGDRTVRERLRAAGGRSQLRAGSERDHQPGRR